MAGGEGGAEEAAAEDECARVVIKLRFKCAASYSASNIPSSPPLLVTNGVIIHYYNFIFHLFNNVHQYIPLMNEVF